MKKTELDMIFTNKVSEYIAKGYIINTNSMAGHQGEIAKIDLRKSDEVLRIVMLQLDFTADGKKFCILVGRSTDTIDLNACSREIIWTNHLEIIEKLTFIAISDNWYLPEEEGKQEYQKKYERYKLRRSYMSYEKPLNITANFIRGLKSRKGFSNATRNNIKVVRTQFGYKITHIGRGGSSKVECIMFPKKDERC